MAAPRFSGFGSFREVLAESAFWQAGWFSLRFRAITALLQGGLGLFFAVYFTPLIRRNGWIAAILIIPMIVATAMMGLMERLVLREFVGPVYYYFHLWLGWSPALLGTANVFATVVAAESLQWPPFAFLLFPTACQSIPRGCAKPPWWMEPGPGGCSVGSNFR